MLHNIQGLFYLLRSELKKTRGHVLQTVWTVPEQYNTHIKTGVSLVRVWTGGGAEGGGGDGEQGPGLTAAKKKLSINLRDGCSSGCAWGADGSHLQIGFQDFISRN